MKDKIDAFWFLEPPSGYISGTDLEQYDTGRLGCVNTHFDHDKAHVLYNQYHEQYGLADGVGFDGIMTNEHHFAFWCMKLV